MECFNNMHCHHVTVILVSLTSFEERNEIYIKEKKPELHESRQRLYNDNVSTSNLQRC